MIQQQVLSKQTITITALAYGGDAVGCIDGRPVFIPACVPGDTIEADILQDKGSFMRGISTKLISSSPDRTEPSCPIAETCGGCQWQSVRYKSQLTWKQKIVRETLRRIGGVDNIVIDPCLPSPADGNYRTIARYPARMTKGGLIFGYYERRTHRIVNIESCPVATDKVNTTASSLRIIINKHFSSLDIRELTLQCSHNHPSMLLNITLGSKQAFSESLKSIITDIEDLSGVFVRYAESPEVSRFIKTYGDHYRYETINGIQFRIHERSFFQINIPQTEKLVDTVKEMIGDVPGKKIIDGYGGVGLFSLSIADQNSDIYLFDTSATAVKDSIYNARKLGLRHFHGFTEPAVSAFEKIGKADILIIDPPRTGLGQKAVNAACSTDAGIIVYVSCNPSTLARDLKMFCESGYEIQRAVPVDMFPYTYHIETVVKLQKK